MPSTKAANRLQHETSPYLLQHQFNPVEWWPWGEAALDEAQRTNRPILLSVGYAACHWCHVMAHESFENEAIAGLMNALFVNIKVDREERPDIDQIYMAALHHMGEQGGWPLTMFLTPNGEPFWGGTYFPPQARYGRAAFPDILREVDRVWREEPGKIAQSSKALMRDLRRSNLDGAAPSGTISAFELTRVARSIAAATDPVHGGLNGAPKFPQCSMLEFLFRAGLRTDDARFFETVDLALIHMCQGGIFDHLGGGFSRYSVDARWLVPHFEKMLYDNAQLIDLLLLSHSRQPNALFKARLFQTVEWLLTEMQMPGGGFAASLDADSEGEEGKFYVWLWDEVRRVLGAENAALCAAQYDISAGGNFEGHNILNRLKTLDYHEADEPRFSMLRSMLQQERSKRIPPARDDKILADWNGLTIASMLRAGAALEKPAWIYAAQQAYDFAAISMSRERRLGHSWREGRLTWPGLASDYAAMIRAALAQHEITGDAKYLADALRWQEMLEDWHSDAATGLYFLSASDAPALIIRPQSTLDDATPNHHGLIAENLIRLAALTHDSRWAARLETLFKALMPLIAQNTFAHLSMLNALDLHLAGLDIVITGEDANADALHRAALNLPHTMRMIRRVENIAMLDPAHAAHQARPAHANSAAYICAGQTCFAPVHDVASFHAAIKSLREQPSA